MRDKSKIQSIWGKVSPFKESDVGRPVFQVITLLDKGVIAGTFLWCLLKLFFLRHFLCLLFLLDYTTVIVLKYDKLNSKRKENWS